MCVSTPTLALTLTPTLTRILTPTQAGFRSKLMELSDAAVAFMERADLDARVEIAADARALASSLQQALDQASLYNSREVLFDEPQTGYSMLKVRVIPLTP